MYKLLFLILLCLLLSGCPAYHSGGAEYLYYDKDPSTNATTIMTVKSVREVGPTKVKIICRNGDNITIATEGMKPGPSDMGKALEATNKALDLAIKAGAMAVVP